jgi:putative transposase
MTASPAPGWTVDFDFTRRGKLTDDGHIESFNGRLRDEYPHVHQFRSLADAW